ncbi:energy-coupling factor ABC transporter ATP-binding protein [Lutispora sp.]|uniref:energy-coupling factor ABC transporter ATP-binding protein n=1 Tax=Lutispora sp. TaxID=2828727 RepID=UPI002B20FD0B|nr:ATP-binding cassette domain-containing protein [Lutispora sp.]MEA4960063.1 ATP-binding cassette domain-containing protein [Lutispora sp.]
MIKVKSLCFKYEDGTKALNNINIDLGKGKVIGLIGSNGSGKSTLFLNMIGILKPDSGHIEYKGSVLKYDKKFLREYRKKVNIVFQEPDKQLFYPNVFDDVAFSLRNMGVCEGEVKLRVKAALNQVSAYDLKEKPIHFLSYGQKKRVAIAGVLAIDTDIILMDEPTNGLDPHMTGEMKKIIKEISKDKIIVISSHDMDMIYEICDYVYILAKGEVLGEGKTQEVFSHRELLDRAFLERPWLVKIHEGLGLPLFKNEDQLFNYGEGRTKA